MGYLFHSLALVLLLYGVGTPIAALLLPTRWRVFTLVVAPWAAYCYLSLTAWFVYYSGWRLSGYSGACVLVPVVACWVLLYRNTTKGLLAVIPDRATAAALLISVLAFGCLSLPVMLLGGKATTVSMFNHDVALYSAVSRFLAEFGRGSSVGFPGQRAGVFDVWATTQYFGPTAFVALAGSWSNALPHQLTTASINLFSALGCCVTALFARQLLSVSGRVAAVVAVIVALHPGLQYVAYEGFFAQVIGASLSVLMFVAANGATDKTLGRAERLRLLVLLFCLSSGLLLSYPHMLPIVGPLVIFTCGLSRRANNVRSYWGLASAAFAIAAPTLACPGRGVGLVRYLQEIPSFGDPWFIPFVSPDYLLGLSFHNAPFATNGAEAHAPLLFACTGALLLLAVASYERGSRSICAVAACCVVIYGGCFILASKSSAFGGYRSFKIATFFLPLFIATFAAVATGAARRSTRWSTVVGILSAAVICGSAANHLRLLTIMRGMNKHVAAEFTDLLLVDRDREVDSITIPPIDGWNTMWAAYFLMHKHLHMTAHSYYAASTERGNYELYDRATAIPLAARHLRSGHLPPIRDLNDRFSVVGPYSDAIDLPTTVRSADAPRATAGARPPGLLSQLELAAEFDRAAAPMTEARKPMPWNQFVAQQQATLRTSEAGLTVIASGADPAVLLPPFVKDSAFVLQVVIDSPVDTPAQLFCKRAQQSYDEAHSRSVMLAQGRNVVYFQVDFPQIVDPLRFDPGAQPGEYIIESVTARARAAESIAAP